MVKDLISFEICGKMAHFRKYYTSASALSYTIPPKTTVIGLLAGMLGMQRDTYYESFNDWVIGIEVVSPLRKIFQKMNYLKVENTNKKFGLGTNNLQITGVENRTQIAVELLIPENIIKEVLTFKIYVGTKEAQDNNFVKLKDCLKNYRFDFGFALGTANMLGYFQNYNCDYEYEPIKEDKITTKTACLVSDVKLGDIKTILIEQDTFPLKMRTNEKKKNYVTRIAERVEALVYPIGEDAMPLELIQPKNFLKITNGKPAYICLL